MPFRQVLQVGHRAFDFGASDCCEGLLGCKKGSSATTIAAMSQASNYAAPEPITPPQKPEISLVQGWEAYLTDIEQRLGPYVAHREPRQRAMNYLHGLLNPAERKNSWQLAEVSVDPTPYGFQH